MCFFRNLKGLLAFLSLCTQWIQVMQTGKQEYSSRTLGSTWGIITAVMLPIVVVLACLALRILKRRRAEREEEDYMNVKTRPLDPDESVKMTSDDDSIPYKKDVQDSPEPNDTVKVADSPVQPYSPVQQAPSTFSAPDPNAYGLPYPEYSPGYEGPSGQKWSGETEIN